MKFLRLTLLALALSSFTGAAEAALPLPSPLPAAALSADASFADLYRLATAAGLPLPALAQAQGIPVSFSAAPARPQGPQQAATQQAGFLISTGSIPKPGRWPLMLAGLAAAAWVARRRLNYSL